MADVKPVTVDQYKRWLQQAHGIDINRRTETHYHSVVSKIKADFEGSQLWRRLTGALRRYNDQYLLEHGYPLWVSEESPKLVVKDFEPFLLKSFRKNVLENPGFPSPPDQGWILPHNWFSRIDDCVRTLLAVKCLDGVEFVAGQINALCSSSRVKSWSSLEAREEGYYAAHLHI